jgi:ADP-heptose:LPS heptosyltransferase
MKKADLKTKSKLRKIILKCDLSPGDITMLAAAIRDLKRAHSNFLVDVQTSVPQIWENNPHITKLDEKEPGVEVFKTEYPLIHSSNSRPYHFIHGYAMYLEDILGVKIPVTEFKGDIHLSDIEKTWMSQVQEIGVFQDFWILLAGGKYDYTAKWWSPIEYQKVVDHFKSKVLFVQCGQADHFHPPLKGVVNMIGKTDPRQLIRLTYHASGVLCPVTWAMHLAAAVETKRNMPMNRACVVINGGREPVNWEAYPHHRFLAVNGALDCCEQGGCWRSRTFPLEDGDEKDNSLCAYPEEINYEVQLPPKRKKQKLKLPKCMNMIKAEDVIRAVETYYEGGSLKYDGGWEKAKGAFIKKGKKKALTHN